MLLDNFSDLFQRGLEYAWDCEHLLQRQLPKMLEAATSPELKRMFELHLMETRKHIVNLDKVFTRLERSPAAEKSEPIRTIVEECDRIIGHLDPSALLDAALAFSTSQIEYYEVGLYRSLSGFAKALNLVEVVALLDEILGEERDVASQLTRLAEGQINPAACAVHNSPPFALI